MKEGNGSTPNKKGDKHQTRRWIRKVQETTCDGCGPILLLLAPLQLFIY